jgi:hypothetical protein
MKEKQITLKVKGITHKQWSNLLLELNLIKKAWKPYGVDINLNAPGLRNVLSWGTRIHDYIRPTRRASKSVSQNKGS